MRVVHIEAKQRIAEADAATLEHILAKHLQRDLTPADASVLSGLPIDAAEAGLLVLSSRYPARIRVSPNGVLSFRFESLRPHGPSPLAAFAGALRRRLVEPALAAATVVLGPLLLAVLVIDTYALVSVARDHGLLWLVGLPCLIVGLGAMLAAILTSMVFLLLPLLGIVMVVAGVFMVYLAFAEPGRDGPIGVLVIALMVLGLGWFFGRWGVAVWWRIIVREPTWAKELWQSVVVFLVGPAQRRVDALADERQLAALIRTRAGVITLSDLVGLFGWTPAEADAQVARILVDYGGDIAVDDDGAIVYVFDDDSAVSGADILAGSLMSAQVEVAAPVRSAPRATPFFETAASVLALVALTTGALGVLFDPSTPRWPASPEALFPLWAVESPDAMRPIQLGLWPYAFAFGALLLRTPWHIVRRVREARRLALEPYLAIAATSPAGAPLANANLRIVATLGADYDAGQLSFPELALAARAAERLRHNALGPTGISPSRPSSGRGESAQPLDA